MSVKGVFSPHINCFQGNNKASENARPRLMPNHGNIEMVTSGAKLGLCGLLVDTPLTSVNTMFEIDWVIIIPHNGTFTNNGQKWSFSVILIWLWIVNLQRLDWPTHQLNIYIKIAVSLKYLQFLFRSNQNKIICNLLQGQENISYYLWYHTCQFVFKQNISV